MKFSKKIIIVLLFVIGIAGLLVGSIAYYRIVVNGSITGSTGNAVFVLRDTEAGESWNNKVISLGQINPGDNGSFDVVMDASGSTVDMYATLNIEINNLPSNLKFYTTSDHKSELNKYYSFLEKNKTNKETLTVYWYWNPYLDDSEDSNYMNRNISATINVNAVQISEYATMKNGSKVTYSEYDEIEELTGTEFWNEVYRPYIRTVNFDNDLSNLPSTCTEENLCWDISESSTQKKKVYGYLVDTGLKDKSDNTKSLYNLYIVSEAPIFAPSDSRSIFTFNLIKINFNDIFNTSNVTNMSYMFYGCSSLTSLDLSSFNTSNVTNMECMFWECSSLTSLDLSSFNTEKVNAMNYMFNFCSSLTSLNLSSFNTANVTDMSGMLCYCSSLTSLDLSSFNTANVTDMSGMFVSCSSLTNLDLSSFNTANVIDMNNMFNICESLTNLDLSNFNTSNVTNMAAMFASCSSLTNLNLSSFNTEKVNAMNYMFNSCSSLTSLDLSSFNTANVKNMDGMFSFCSSLKTLNLSSFDISNSYRISSFYKCSNLITTFNVTSKGYPHYENVFLEAATEPGAKIVVNYVAAASDLVDKMIATKSENSNVVKGNIIPEYTITVNGNDDIKYTSNNTAKGSKIKLTSISGNNYVTSFKMNEKLINDSEFIMPDENVTITDIITVEPFVINVNKDTYSTDQINTIIGEHKFEGAKKLKVELSYVTLFNTEYFYIFDSNVSTIGINNNRKFNYCLSWNYLMYESFMLDTDYIKFVLNSKAGKDFTIKATVVPYY